ncbi:MAG UNVERIFIED_CONTAM: hypothetical protein LVR29_25235 [Microcystis novacekii LVE1205-3]|jgi:cysteine desulfurase
MQKKFAILNFGRIKQRSLKCRTNNKDDTDKFTRGYRAKIDKPPSKPPQGGSNVKPPPNQDKEQNLGGYSPFTCSLF